MNPTIRTCRKENRLCMAKSGMIRAFRTTQQIIIRFGRHDKLICMCKIKLAHQLVRANFKCNHRHMKSEHTVHLLLGQLNRLAAVAIAMTLRQLVLQCL
jgi:hypothetical protein